MKILIVGVGSIGTRHFKNLLELGYKDLAVIDVVRNSLSNILKIKKVPVYRDFDVALEKVCPDVVFICTGTGSHVSLLKKSLLFGADVFVEKPISNNLTELSSVAKIANEKKKIVMVGCNYLFHEGIRKLSSILKSNIYGKPVFYRVAIGYYLPSARSGENYKKIYAANKNEGGVLLDSGSHAVNYLCSFFGPIKKNFSFKENQDITHIQSEEIAYMFLKHISGVSGNVTLDYISKKPIHLIEITTEKGIIALDIQEDSLFYFSEKENPKCLYKGKKDQNKMFIEELRHFFSAVKKRTKPIQDARDGFEILKTLINS